MREKTRKTRNSHPICSFGEKNCSFPFLFLCPCHIMVDLMINCVSMMWEYFAIYIREALHHVIFISAGKHKTNEKEREKRVRGKLLTGHRRGWKTVSHRSDQRLQLLGSKNHNPENKSIVCPKSSDEFHMVTNYIKWVTTSWTDGNKLPSRLNQNNLNLNG